jgi:hypothetical protein
LGGGTEIAKGWALEGILIRRRGEGEWRAWLGR